MKKLTDHIINGIETNSSNLRNESDVEQRVLYPLFVNSSFMGYDPSWVLTQEFCAAVTIGKGSRKRQGYKPDYMISIAGFPLLICEAKETNVSVDLAIAEARMYASEINSRYPTNSNPITIAIGSNGIDLAFSPADSVETKIFKISDLNPSSAALQELQELIGSERLKELGKSVVRQNKDKKYFSVSNYMGGQSKLNEQLGINEFGAAIQPYIQNYFDPDNIEHRDEIIEKAYVSSDEITTYDRNLETYLKDRTKTIFQEVAKKIHTSKKDASGISDILSKYASNPNFFGRVQLIIGSVGSGKSTFIYRFYKFLCSDEVLSKTAWAFIDFNEMPPSKDELLGWIVTQFIASIREGSDLDIDEYDEILAILSLEAGKFEKGPNKILKDSDPAEYNRKFVAMIEEIISDPQKYSACISRHLSTEKGVGVVVVFDNVDRRDPDEQLQIFEAAQWLRGHLKSLIIVNLRDATFEAYKDSPPLDAFANAINFYISPPRFSQVIRKRVELLLSKMSRDHHDGIIYGIETGAKVRLDGADIGKFLTTFYSALFDNKNVKMTAILESLVARNVRRALSMFQEIILSPHVLASEATGASFSSKSRLVREHTVVRALMRERYKYYNNRSKFVFNLLKVDENLARPNIFIYSDIVEYLVRNRKSKIDFSIEGYATVETLSKHLASLGYDQGDTMQSIQILVDFGMIEPESLIDKEISLATPVRAHSIGFIHTRYFLSQPEYLLSISTGASLSSEAVARKIGSYWAGVRDRKDMSLYTKKKVLDIFSENVQAEFDNRCKNHPNYKDNGFGGQQVLSGFRKASASIDEILSKLGEK